MRETTKEEIKAVAWRQIAEFGAPALSLRAIAREMGLTAPALYRYFEDRDALVGALVIDAFDSFAAALEAARDSRPPADHAGRIRAIGAAYRKWALHYPQRYVLIFGTPIPRYCPAPETMGAGRRSFSVLLESLNDAQAAGALRIPSRPAQSPMKFSAWVEELLSQPENAFSPEVLQLALSTWSWIHGLVSLELCGQLPSFLGEQTGLFFAAESEGFLGNLGFTKME